jgi:hypothetical protein
LFPRGWLGVVLASRPVSERLFDLTSSRPPARNIKLFPFILASLQGFISFSPFQAKPRAHLHALILLQAVLVASCLLSLVISAVFCSLPSYLLSLVFLFFYNGNPFPFKAAQEGYGRPRCPVCLHPRRRHICPPSLPLHPFSRCSRPAWSGARASPTFSPANTTSRLPNGPPAPAQGSFPPLLAHANGTRSHDAPQDRVLQNLAGLTVRLTYPIASHVTSLHLLFHTRVQPSPC